MPSQERIFQKFGSLEAGSKGYSTGLGLPFCKIVAEMHGGAIGVRSQVDRGSTFWFTLPKDGPQSKAGSKEVQLKPPYPELGGSPHVS